MNSAAAGLVSSERLRLVFLCNSPAVPAGVEKTTRLLLEHLDRDRFAPRVILNGEGPFADGLRELDVDLEVLPCRGRTSPAWRRALRMSLKQRPADVVQLHLSRLNAPLLRRTGARLVERLNMTRDPRIRHPLALPWLDRFTSRWIDRFIVVSETLRNAFLARGYPAHKLHVVHNGVQPPEAADPARLRRELGIAPGVPLIGAVGRLTPQKGMDCFVETVCELRTRHPTVRAVIAGDGELRAALEARVELCGLRNTLRFLGFRQDVWDILAGLDVLVLLSRWEPFANILLEAMAVGTPIVASNVAGNREALTEAETAGLLVPPERPDLAAEAVGRVLADPELHRRLSEGGSRRARDFTVERMVRQHEQVYVQATTAAPGQGSGASRRGPEKQAC